MSKSITGNELRFVFRSKVVALISLLDSYSYGLRGRVSRNLPKSLKRHFGVTASLKRFRWAFLLWGIGFLIPMVVIAFEQFTVLQIFPLAKNATQLADILKVLTSIPLALVGLVFPFLALSTTMVYAKMGFGAVAHSFKHNGIINFIFFALVALAADVVLFIMVQVPANATPSIPAHYILLIAITFTGVLLVGSAILIYTVIQSFQPRVAFRQMSEVLLREGMSSLRQELAMIMAQNILAHDLKKTRMTVPVWRPDKGQRIYAQRSGIVSNVSALGLKLIDSHLLSRSSDDDISVSLTPPYSRVDIGGQPLATVAGAGAIEVGRLIEQPLRACFRIKSSMVREYKLQAVMEEYGETTRRFAESDTESLLRIALEGYRWFFDSYHDLRLDLKAEDSPHLLSDWAPITFIIHDLHAVVEIAVREPRRMSVGCIAHWLQTLLEKCVAEKDEYIFSRILPLFQTMFRYSAKSDHLVGLDRSHSVPLHVLDHTVFWKLENVSSNLAETRYRLKLSWMILHHLHYLLKLSVDSMKVGLVKEMLRVASPGEVLTSPRLHVRDSALAAGETLKNTSLSGEERKQLQEQVEATDLINSMQGEYARAYRGALFGATQYLIERLAHEDCRLEDVKSIFEVLWPTLGGVEESAAWLDECNKGQGPNFERLWEYWPESRRVQSRDPFESAISIFVLKGLHQQKFGRGSIKVPPLQIVEILQNRIVERISEIAKGAEWDWLVGEVSADNIETFEQSLKSAVYDYQRKVAEEIRNSPLSSERIKRFKAGVVQGFSRGTRLVHLLSTMDLVLGPNVGESHPLSPKLRGEERKEFFTERIEDISFQRGEHYGDALARSFDVDVIELISKRGSSTVQVDSEDEAAKALEDYLMKLGADQKKDLSVLTSKPFLFTYRLRKNANFHPNFDANAENPPVPIGRFCEVPVYSLHEDLPAEIIVCHLRDIRLMSIPSPGVEVRLYTEEEIKKLTPRSEEELRLVVLVNAHIEMNVHIGFRQPPYLLKLPAEDAF